ncbi:hypothetical protein WV31_20070 [Magnetospirillum sp. ME-1]|uniref:hypothetical protein n=1 Tax=Magnetospirillum sp. ME-1 TaxID=1639348 RepID=UPI000A17C635|nr:hypothetical protein [Magnetospirillum sp. ME-1]ARJ67787.1 hypothetical protein WV31_20070 [Magnetospirillum sp. ME-1]
MKTILKTLAALALVGFVASCAAQAADPTPTPQTWGPGWRHEQMLKAQKDGTFVPGRGPGYGMWGGGPGYGRGMMAQAIGADGKIDVSKLPAGCPMRQGLIQAPTQ